MFIFDQLATILENINKHYCLVVRESITEELSGPDCAYGLELLNNEAKWSHFITSETSDLRFNNFSIFIDTPNNTDLYDYLKKEIKDNFSSASYFKFVKPSFVHKFEIIKRYSNDFELGSIGFIYLVSNSFSVVGLNQRLKDLKNTIYFQARLSVILTSRDLNQEVLSNDVIEIENLSLTVLGERFIMCTTRSKNSEQVVFKGWIDNSSLDLCAEVVIGKIQLTLDELIKLKNGDEISFDNGLDELELRLGESKLAKAKLIFDNQSYRLKIVNMLL